MMDHIGSPDKQLRDDLIYTAFATWILENHLFDSDQLHQLLMIALDDQHIFYFIGETNTDSIFTRSFSVLLLPLILIAHRQKPFLPKSEITRIKERLLQYLFAEKDLRGYVEGKGWAHAVAHVGDVFDDLAQCLEVESADLSEILEAIAAKICVDSIPYVHEEDERMTTAVVSILRRQLLDETDVENWIRSFATRVQKTEPSPANHTHLNVKNFLRSLYFRMYQQDIEEKLTQAVAETLHEISYYKD
ncbi:MAG: DUF2785 domain-containing protein [Ardenticatenales bacterium]|nr:DUF2785 domain-containing protein [Ardenticatenales bacterium]